MLRPLLPILLLVAAALLLPAAQAQQTQPVLVVSLDAFESPLAPGERAVLRGVAEFASEFTALTDTTGIEVHYSILDAPEWAGVTLSPTKDVIFLHPGPTASAHVEFEVVVDVPSSVTDVRGMIEIGATTSSHALFRGAEARGATPLVVKGPLPPACADDAEGLSAQSADTPRLSVPAGGLLPLVAALGAAAAVAGGRRGRVLSPLAGLVLVALALGGVALAAAPEAQAQASQPTLLLRAQQPLEALEPGAVLSVPLVASYVSDASSLSSMSGVPVAFRVTGPDWVTVTLSPSTAVFQPRHPGPATMVDQVKLTAEIVVSEDLPRGMAFPVVVEAVTQGSHLYRDAEAHALLALRIAGDSCGTYDAALSAPAEEAVAAGGARR